MRATLEGWLYVPHSAIRGGAVGVSGLQQHLTYLPKFAEPGTEPVRLFDDGRPGYLGVPRAFGLHHFSGIEIEDRRSLGYPITVPRLPDPNHPRVKDPAKQAAFTLNLKSSLVENHGLIGHAGTGTGKTVCALSVSAQLGGTTLVLLHLGRLLDQWMDEIHDKLGVPMNQIGVIRGDRCDFEGKPYVVGMLHSLASRGLGGPRGYPIELADNFRTVIGDEIHKAGTGQFAPVISMFNSFYRLGLTATPERTDGGDRVFYWHIGPIRVRSEAEPLPMDVYVMDYDCGHFEMWGKNLQARAACLTKIPQRNVLITRTIKRFYDTGRQALIVSDSVLHLQNLMDAAEQAGVPRSAMGQFTGAHQTPTWIPDPEQPGKQKRKIVLRKHSKEELDYVKANAQLIFATYGMMTEGIDIPRLDAGLDATPRANATQLIGRIRRPVEGKKRPVWITLRDVRCSYSKGAFYARCKDYAASGAEVKVNGRTTRQPRRGTLAARAQAWTASRNAGGAHAH